MLQQQEGVRNLPRRTLAGEICLVSPGLEVVHGVEVDDIDRVAGVAY
jgi:hypothetical protein